MSLPELLLDGVRVDARIDGRVTGLRHIRTMEGAASIEVTLDDPDAELLRGGLVTKPGKPTKRAKTAGFDRAAWARVGESRLIYEGIYFRLAGYDISLDANGGTLTLTFEDEIASLMRHATKAIKSSRNTQTRAMFIHMLLGAAYRRRRFGFVPFVSPEEDARQKIAQPDLSSLKKGLSRKAHLTIKGIDIDAAQRSNLEAALEEADTLRAGDRPVLAMLVGGIGESAWRNVVNSIGYGGVLQGQVSVAGGTNWFASMSETTRTREQAQSFQTGGRGYQAGGAMHLAASDATLSPGAIATKVEASGMPAGFYQQWIDEAQAILDAWGGTDVIHTTRQRYTYRAGGKRKDGAHNYWEDAGDLAQEVRWRLFADANILYYASDDWLFARRPSLYIDHGLVSSGVLAIQGGGDVGIPAAEITVTARTHDWNINPAAVVVVDELGNLDGRWLVWRSEYDRLNDQATVTLHRPAPKRKEPAPATRTTSAPATSDDTLDNGLVFPLPGSAALTDLGGVAAHQGRAWGNWQSDNAVDIGCPLGTPVYAVDDGKIVRLGGSYDGTGMSNPNGFNVTLLTKNNQWFYTHMRHRLAHLNVGDKVVAGQLLGESGAANGVKHLHIASEHGDPERLLEVKATVSQ
jgi:murein DD-endopeptidase MepM/ murein hydrolase activator NlpD